MIRIQLPPAEVERLEQEFRSTDDRKLRDRLQIILLAHRGRKHQDIAADLCIHRRSVQRWLNAYLERGLGGLRPRKAKGAPGTIPAGLADEILLKTHGIRTSRSAMHRFCSRIDIRPYRPTYRFLRGDPDKQARAKEDIAALKKKPKRANSCC